MKNLPNIFENIPDNLPEEIIEDILKTDNLEIKRIISKGHASPSGFWYDQKENEWVILLKGKACLVFEGEKKIILKSGDYIFIPAHKKHRVEWTDPDKETVWLAVHFI